MGVIAKNGEDMRDKVRDMGSPKRCESCQEMKEDFEGDICRDCYDEGVF